MACPTTRPVQCGAMKLGSGRAALILGTVLVLGGCGGAASSRGGPSGGLGTPAPSLPPTAATTPTESTTPTLDLTGNTSDIPILLANALGCTNVDYNAQLDNWVHSEITCLLDGDNEVTIFSFVSAANAQKWFALGPESADESGTVVMGDRWAVEPFNESQVQHIQQVVGGVISKQP